MFHKIIARLRAGSASENFLLIAPLAYLIWEALLYRARGPNWVMVPQDLSYNYLLNALNVLNGDPIGSLIHPALTTIGYIAAVTWLAHLFFGSGPLAAAVIGDPEFYFSFSVHGTTLLTALCLYLMGRWAYQGLRSPWLVLLLQSFIFLPPAPSMVLNSFASPESMVFMLAMLQIGLTLRAIDGRLESRAEQRNYITATALIGSAAVATKFIAVPLLIIPFLMLPTWRSKVSYCIAICVGLAISLSPIVLLEAHRTQFALDMKALSMSAVSESQGRGVGATLGSYAANATPILSDFAIHVYSLGFGLVLLLILALYQPVRRTAVQYCPQALRLFVIAQVVSVIAFIFVLGRPKAHYLVPFILLQSMGYATFFVIAGRHLSISNAIDAGRVAMVTRLICAGFIGVVCGNNGFSSKGLPQLDNVRSAAIQMNALSYGALGNNAIITAIQASNIPTALYHAHSTSRHLLWENLGAAVPQNHYDYAYDGLHANRYRTDTVSIADIMEMYDRVLFWTTTGNFAQHEWRKPIEAVWKDIRVAAFERLSEIEALAIQDRFDDRLTDVQNASRGWNIDACIPEAICLGFRADAVDRKVISHIRFLADPDQFATMPTRWRIEASDDGRIWQTVENFVDHRPWTKVIDVDWPPTYKRAEEIQQNRVYRLNNDRFYPFYRLIFPQQATLKSLPGQVVAYAAGGCAPDIRALPAQMTFVGKDDSTLPGIDAVSGGFWEEVGAFPKVLATSSMALKPQRYLVGTGNDGENGKDSWGRMPRSWLIEGSKDGMQWTELDRQAAVPQWQANEVRAFPIKASETFTHFRLVVSETTEGGVVRVYRFRIEGDAPPQKHPKDRFAGKGLDAMEFHERAVLPVTLQSKFEQPVYITSYGLHVGPYGADSTDRMPKNWRLFGSADGETWQLTDSRRDQIKWRNGEQRVYRMANPGRFKYLRLEVTDVANSHVFRLSSIRFFTPRIRPSKKTC